MKHGLIFFAFMALILIIVSCSGLYANLRPSLPDLSNIEDGVYRGEFNLPNSGLSAILDVTVQNALQ